MNILYVRGSAGAMAQRTGFDARRDQRAVRCFPGIEVTAILFHVRFRQSRGMTGRAHGRVRRNDDVIDDDRGIDGVDGRAQDLAGFDRMIGERVGLGDLVARNNFV